MEKSGELIALGLPLPLHVHTGIGQTVHQIGSAILGKEFSHTLGHHAAKTINLADLFLGCFPDGLQRAKML